MLFDFGGTLVDGEIDYESARKEIVTLLSKDCRLLSLKEYETIEQKVFNERWKNVLKTMREITFKQMIGQILHQFGIDDEKIVERIKQTYHKYYLPKPKKNLEKVLEKMSEEFKLGVVSNTSTDLPEITLKKLNLITYFDVVVLSCRYGFRKPHPAIFNHALESLGGIRPEEAVFVGNSLKFDVAGAKNSNITSIWLEEDPDFVIEPDFKVKELSEIPDLIYSIEKQQKR